MTEGAYIAITASAALRAASAPIPPQTSTKSSFSKKRKRRPPTSFSMTRHSLISGPTSRSSAATMATLDISVALEPLHRPPQCPFDRHDLPAQFALRLAGTGKHLFPSHANRVHSGARLAVQHTPGNRLVNYSRGKGEHVGQLHLRRRQPRDLSKLVQNLLQRKILAAQNVALTRLPSF